MRSVGYALQREVKCFGWILGYWKIHFPNSVAHCTGVKRPTLDNLVIYKVNRKLWAFVSVRSEFRMADFWFAPHAPVTPWILPRGLNGDAYDNANTKFSSPSTRHCTCWRSSRACRRVTRSFTTDPKYFGYTLEYHWRSLVHQLHRALNCTYRRDECRCDVYYVLRCKFLESTPQINYACRHESWPKKEPNAVINCK